MFAFHISPMKLDIFWNAENSHFKNPSRHAHQFIAYLSTFKAAALSQRWDILAPKVRSCLTALLVSGWWNGTRAFAARMRRKASKVGSSLHWSNGLVPVNIIYSDLYMLIQIKMPRKFFPPSFRPACQDWLSFFGQSFKFQSSHFLLLLAWSQLLDQRNENSQLWSTCSAHLWLGRYNLSIIIHWQVTNWDFRWSALACKQPCCDLHFTLPVNSLADGYWTEDFNGSYNSY